MIQLEDQLSKILTESDEKSNVSIHLKHGKEINFTNKDLIYVGAESLKLIKRPNRLNRSKIKIVPYNAVEFISYNISEANYNIYVAKATENTNPIPQIDDVDPNEVDTGNATITIKNTQNLPISNITIKLTKDELSYTGTTNNEGQTTIEDVIYNEYDIEITGEGYITKTSKITIDSAENNKEFTIEAVNNDTPQQEPVEPVVETGDIQITVTNTDNNLVEGATITLTKNDQTLTETTDVTGQATFEAVPHGKYTVKITKEGYTDFEDEITLDVDFDMEDFKLLKTITPTDEEEADFEIL